MYIVHRKQSVLQDDKKVDVRQAALEHIQLIKMIRKFPGSHWHETDKRYPNMNKMLPKTHIKGGVSNLKNPFSGRKKKYQTETISLQLDKRPRKRTHVKTHIIYKALSSEWE